MNKVYIILVNYNNYTDTIECLESLLKSSYLNFQIFVVDNSINNSSIDNLSDWINNNNYKEISTNFQDLVLPLEAKPIDHIIVNENEFTNSDDLYENKITIIRAKNNGFAAANNIILKYIIAKANDLSLIWVLNNDTVVEKDTLSNLVNFYNDNSNKCIIGAKLKYYYKPNILQAIAGNYNIWIGKHYHIGDGQEDYGQYNNYKFGKSDYIVGASVFFSKSFIDAAGLICEDYFLYFEELDWMKVGGKHGFTMALASNAIVYHKEGASVTGGTDKEKDTFIAEYYSIINRVRFIKKWYPYNLVTIMPGVFIALIKRIIKGKYNLVKKSTTAIFKILFFEKFGTDH